MALVPTIIRAFSMTWNICAMPSCTSPSSQPLAGSRAIRVAEGDLAGVGHLDAHLVLDVGDVDAVALAGQLAGLVVEVELRHDEQAEALGAGAADALDAHAGGRARGG